MLPIHVRALAHCHCGMMLFPGVKLGCLICRHMCPGVLCVLCVCVFVCLWFGLHGAPLLLPLLDWMDTCPPLQEAPFVLRPVMPGEEGPSMPGYVGVCSLCGMPFAAWLQAVVAGYEPTLDGGVGVAVALTQYHVPDTLRGRAP